MSLVLTDFDVDRVWTVGQVERWGLEVPPSARVVEGYLGLTHYRKSRPVQFFVKESLAHLPLTTLRHLAGVSEMRLLLGVEADPQVWRVFHRQVHPVDEPDAVWLTSKGPVAVEYDVGSYSRDRVRAKAAAFATRYVGQVWGTPVVERLRTLVGLLPKDATALVAPWW